MNEHNNYYKELQGIFYKNDHIKSSVKDMKTTIEALRHVFDVFRRNIGEKDTKHYLERLKSKLTKSELRELGAIVSEIASQVPRELFTPTPNQLHRAIKKKQHGTLDSLDTEHKKDTILFIKQLIREDVDLTEEEKTEAVKTIDDNNNPYFLLDRWLGKKFTRQENIVLRALRGIIYRQLLECKITGFDGWINIKLCNIYENCGVSKHKDGKFHSREMKKIREILLSSNLTKRILVKSESNNIIRSTRFITELKFNEVKVKIVKNGVEQEQIQHTQVKIKISDFLFAGVKEGLKDSTIEDTSGFSRFIKKNKTAIGNDLFFYLEKYISRSDKTKELNLTTIIDTLEISRQFSKDKKRTKETIERALNDMQREKTLIKSWKLTQGDRGQDKYVFENLRYTETSAKITKFPIKSLKKSKEK